MRTSVCRLCGQPISLSPYAPGMDGPVLRWQHSGGARLCNLPGNRQSLSAFATPDLTAAR